MNERQKRTFMVCIIPNLFLPILDTAYIFSSFRKPITFKESTDRIYLHLFACVIWIPTMKLMLKVTTSNNIDCCWLTIGLFEHKRFNFNDNKFDVWLFYDSFCRWMIYQSNSADWIQWSGLDTQENFKLKFNGIAFVN